MKKLISLLLTFVLLISVIPSAVMASSANSFGWTASSTGGNTAIKVTDSIRGSAVAFKAWGTTDAEMSATKDLTGAYNINTYLLFSDFNAVRKLTASGIDMLTVDKSGAVKSSGATLAGSIELNKWYPLEIVAYPTINKYTVSFNGVSETFTVSELPDLGEIALKYSEISSTGTSMLITDPAVGNIAAPVEAQKPSRNAVTWTTDTKTATNAEFYYKYDDPTGAGRGLVNAVIVDGANSADIRTENDMDFMPAQSDMAEISFDFYVPEIQSGETVPEVTKFQVIANTTNTSYKWYYFFTIDHTSKLIKKGSTVTDGTQLNYSYGAWHTARIYIDYPNDMIYVRILDADGRYIGGLSYEEDLDANHFDTSSNKRIASYSLQHSFKDSNAQYTALIDNYNMANRGTEDAVITDTVPYSGAINVDAEKAFVFNYAGAAIEPASVSSASVILDSSAVAAQIGVHDDSLTVKLSETLLPGTTHTLELSGLTDVRGNSVASKSITFTTATDEAVGNLSLTESSDTATAAVQLGTTAENLNLYSVAYSSDGAVADYDKTPVAAGAINDTKEASATAAYTKATAMLWDDSMNIITPAISTEYTEPSYSVPCDVMAVKNYETNIVTIKGTANGGAAIILKDENGDVEYIGEAQAFANGYFERSFYSEVTGDVEFLVNLQDGQGIKTLPYTFYSQQLIDDTVDAFDYLAANPEYDETDEQQYNAMVSHYDDLIREHYALLGISLTEYNSVSQDLVASYLLDGSYSNINDVIAEAEKAMAYALFIAAEGEDDIENLLIRFPSVYNHTTSQVYSLYENMTPGEKDALHLALADKNDYADNADILNFFEQYVVLVTIEKATEDSTIYNLLTNYNSYLLLNLTDYNKLRAKSDVASYVRGKAYESVELFKADFISKVAQVKADEDSKKLVWASANTDSKTKVEAVDTIKGNATLLSTYMNTKAAMEASVACSGSYSAEFSVMFRDLKADRAIKMSGINIISVDKSGNVKVGTEIISKATINKWHDVVVTAHPQDGTYSVIFDGEAITVSGELSLLDKVSVECANIEASGSALMISEVFIDDIVERTSVKDKEFTAFDYNPLLGAEPKPTRSWLIGNDPTGRGKSKVYKHVQNTGVEGEFRVSSDPSITASGILEYKANLFVPALRQGETTPYLTAHKSTPKFDGTWFNMYEINHASRVLKIGSQTISLGSYDYNQWLEVRVYLNLATDKYKVYVFDESGSLLGAGENTAPDASAITANCIIFAFKDENGGYTTYLEDYSWRLYGTSANVSEIIPAPGAVNVPADKQVYVAVSGSAIDPISAATADVKVDGTVLPGAVITLNGMNSFYINVGTLAEGHHTVSVEGLKDVSGNAISGIETEYIVASGGHSFENIELAETSGTITAAVPVKTAPSNFTLYSLAYNNDGSMVDYNAVDTSAGEINATVTSPLAASTYDFASAYLWDANMNIITPNISTGREDISYAAPCDVVVSKSYGPEKVTIKGTAKGGASIILKDSVGTTVFVKEADALPNGYFETSFASTITGQVTLIINTQDGSGKQTKTFTLYTAAESDNAVDAFNYPTYDKTNPAEYAAMVSHYDTLINTHYQHFGFNLAEYASVNKDDVAEILSSGTYAQVSDVLERYDFAMMIALFNAANSSESMQSVFERYSEDCDISTSPTYSYYNKLTDTAKSKVYENVSDKNDFRTVAEIISCFAEQTILAAVECATLDSEVSAIISENNAYLGLDLTKFNSLLNKSAVTSQILGNAYTSVEALKDDFIAKVTYAYNNQYTGQDTGGGGGGGGAAFEPPKQEIKLPVDSEVIENALRPETGFVDIREVPWAEESILYLAEKGIINGKSKTHFAPSDNIKRCEFVKILTLAFPDESYIAEAVPFKDVEQGAWYEAYVKEAYSRGLINGKSADTFGVNDNITREEIMTLLYRISDTRGIDLTPSKSVLFDDDAQISDYARAAIYALAEAEIVSGSSNNMLMPKNHASRAEAAKLVYYMMQREVE